MRLPTFYLKYSFELSVYILGSHKCNFVVGFPILDVQYLILFGIILLLKRNKMTIASISSAGLFLFFFQRTLSLKSCIKQPKSYLKSKKIEIRFIRSFYFMQFLQITCEINISLKVVPRRCSINKVFLKISQNSLEITCAGIFLIIMLHAVALVPRREYTR